MKTHHKFRAFNKDTKEYSYDFVFNKMDRYPDTYIFEQFIDELDIHGAEAHEGDVIKGDQGKVAVIKFEDGAFVAFPNTELEYEESLLCFTEFEVIGNINTNPRLIK